LRIDKKHLFALILLLGFSAQARAEGNVSITDVWIPDAPPVVKVRAGYLIAKNNSDKPVSIIGVSSEAFARIEMHESVYKDGTARMLKKDSVTIPASSGMHFSSGGLHLMLIGATQPLPLGSKVSLEFELSNAEKISVMAVVKPASTDDMDHSHHNH
jgi:copper(I)-binding protein